MFQDSRDADALRKLRVVHSTLLATCRMPVPGWGTLCAPMHGLAEIPGPRRPVRDRTDLKTVPHRNKAVEAEEGDRFALEAGPARTFGDMQRQVSGLRIKHHFSILRSGHDRPGRSQATEQPCRKQLRTIRRLTTAGGTHVRALMGLRLLGRKAPETTTKNDNLKKRLYSRHFWRGRSDLLGDSPAPLDEDSELDLLAIGRPWRSSGIKAKPIPRLDHRGSQNPQGESWSERRISVCGETPLLECLMWCTSRPPAFHGTRVSVRPGSSARSPVAAGRRCFQGLRRPARWLPAYTGFCRSVVNAVDTRTVHLRGL